MGRSHLGSGHAFASIILCFRWASRGSGDLRSFMWKASSSTSAFNCGLCLTARHFWRLTCPPLLRTQCWNILWCYYWQGHGPIWSSFWVWLRSRSWHGDHLRHVRASWWLPGQGTFYTCWCSLPSSWTMEFSICLPCLAKWWQEVCFSCDVFGCWCSGSNGAQIPRHWRRRIEQPSERWSNLISFTAFTPRAGRRAREMKQAMQRFWLLCGGF